jgi:hypothetical protein
MPGYIQIAGDPTKWWLAQPLHAGQLTGQPLSVQVGAPVVGTLFLSGRPGSVAVFDSVPGQSPNLLGLSAPAIYVPTAGGISSGHVGYQLPDSANLDTLSSQIAAAMHDGHIQTIALGGDASGGTLVLDGATASFVVLCQPYPPLTKGSTPHG